MDEQHPTSGPPEQNEVITPHSGPKSSTPQPEQSPANASGPAFDSSRPIPADAIQTAIETDAKLADIQSGKRTWEDTFPNVQRPKEQKPPAENPNIETPDLPSLFSWEASEYVAHQHGVLWYLTVLGVTAALVAFLVLVLREWLSASVVVLMVIALVIYAHRAPRTLRYSLNQAGILVGAKFYPYGVFRSFALVPSQAFLTIELDPLKRFMPRLAMFIDQKDLDGVAETLEEYLPRAERKADVIDRLSHKLKF